MFRLSHLRIGENRPAVIEAKYNSFSLEFAFLEFGFLSQKIQNAFFSTLIFKKNYLKIKKLLKK